MDARKYMKLKINKQKMKEFDFVYPDDNLSEFVYDDESTYEGALVQYRQECLDNLREHDMGELINGIPYYDCIMGNDNNDTYGYSFFSVRVYYNEDKVLAIQKVAHCHDCGGGFDEIVSYFPSRRLEKCAKEMMDVIFDIGR